MKNTFIVISFTIKQMLKKKIFWISNIIIASLIIMLIPLANDIDIFDFSSSLNNNLTDIEHLDLEQIKSNLPQENTAKIIISDKTETFSSYLVKVPDTDKLFIFDNLSSMENLKSKIESEEIYSLIVINCIDGVVSFDYIVKSQTPNDDILASSFSNLFKQIQFDTLLKNEDIPQETILQLSSSISYNVEGLKSNEFLTNTSIVSIVISFILFFTIYLYGSGISTSIASEKNSRVIETLVTSTRPRDIIIGKTLGIGILGVLQLLFLGSLSFLSYKSFISSDLSFLSNIINSIDLSLTNIVLLLVYFILGYILYAFLNSIAGATVGKAEDVQTANMPVSLISMFSFYLALFTARITEGDLYLLTSMLPFSSPFAMPGKILTGVATESQIILSLLILLLSVISLAFISIRIYSVAILHYGNRLKIKDLFNIFIKIR